MGAIAKLATSGIINQALCRNNRMLYAPTQTLIHKLSCAVALMNLFESASITRFIKDELCPQRNLDHKKKTNFSWLVVSELLLM